MSLVVSYFDDCMCAFLFSDVSRSFLLYRHLGLSKRLHGDVVEPEHIITMTWTCAHATHALLLYITLVLNCILSFVDLRERFVKVLPLANHSAFSVLAL